MIGRELLGRGTAAAIDLARAVRPSTRDAERHVRDGWRFREAAASWNDERRRAWTLDRLRAVVRAAARDTPFYRERFRAVGFDPAADFSFDDYGRLPVLERADVHAHGANMQTPHVTPNARRRDSTGGSTGAPLEYWSGPEERGWRTSGQDYYLRRLGVTRGMGTAFLWGHHIDQAERAGWRERMRDAVTNRRWFDCFRLSPDVLLGYHTELERFRPACLVAYASAADTLAQVLLDRGLRANYPTLRVITGAEKLWAHQRARMERVFAAPVHERYGSREAGLIATQLDPSRTNTMEVDFANVLVEPEDDAPEAEILITKLHADAMPMLRYRMGDVARFGGGARPGHPALALDEVLGRRLERLFLPDGRWLHGVGIPHLLKDFPLREFQLRQHPDFSIDVQIVPNDGFDDGQRERIAAVLRANLPGVALHVRPVGEIARGGANKWHPVISMVSPATFGGADTSPASVGADVVHERASRG